MTNSPKTRWIPVLTLLSVVIACDTPDSECASPAVERSESTPAAEAEAPRETPRAAPEVPEAPEPTTLADPLASRLAQAPAPSTPTKATVQGQLDPDLIRRIVRAHINEIRYCYNEGLADDPELAGRVAIAFTIGTSGDVTAVSTAESTLADASVPHCMQAAVARWKFPKPDGDAPVQVTYPFVLEPG
ncbi:MAG: AgmX/PglI C-terminal domain-containing protein [Nannocystaceae bacterium]